MDMRGNKHINYEVWHIVSPSFNPINEVRPKNRYNLLKICPVWCPHLIENTQLSEGILTFCDHVIGNLLRNNGYQKMDLGRVKNN